MYRKKTNCQTILNINSKHSKSLKTSIPYSQASRNKRLCSKTTDFECHLQEYKRKTRKSRLQQKICQSTILISRSDRQKWTSKRKKTHNEETQNKTPLTLTHTHFSPHNSNIVWKLWNIFNISTALQGLCQEELITAFIRI